MIGLSLPLNHLKITDSTTFDELNSVRQNMLYSSRVAPPTSYVSLMYEDSTKSNTYLKTFSCSSATNSYKTAYLYLAAHFNTLRMKVTGYKPSLALNKKMSYSYWYYDVSMASWYGQSFSQATVTNTQSFILITTIDFVQFAYVYNGNMTSITSNVWATI